VIHTIIISLCKGGDAQDTIKEVAKCGGELYPSKRYCP
jgi:hypothetical protein